MTVDIAAPVEALLRERVAQGEFNSVDSAVEAAIQTVFGRCATASLETLLDQALRDERRKVPISELRAMQA